MTEEPGAIVVGLMVIAGGAAADGILTLSGEPWSGFGLFIAMLLIVLICWLSRDMPWQP